MGAAAIQIAGVAGAVSLLVGTGRGISPRVPRILDFEVSSLE